jgi:multidrug efflux pump subunit AcrB
MVKFLIQRPIAVTVIFVAFIVMSMVATGLIPVSLMPEVDIPEIIVKLSAAEKPANEMEEQYVQKIRRQLLQVTHLEDIESSAVNGQGYIRLKFKYGTDINYAFIEVNEKVDALMYYMPEGFQRPRVIKTSATDIPVFYLNVSLRDSSDEERFMQLSEFCNQVVKKRVEQLPEVSMADISGVEYPEMVINVNMDKLNLIGIDRSSFTDALEANDMSIGNIKVRNGLYEFNVRYASLLKDRNDIENLFIQVDNKIFKLKDLAEISIRPASGKGSYLANGKRAVVMAVIKKGNARMSALKEKTSELLDALRKDYPRLRFNVERNQTELLDYSIGNLQFGLLVGGLLAFFLMFLFLKDLKAPLLIGISVPLSLAISLLFFFLFKISINIISLSGLILGVGMMIDNSIIVIDNISQYREQGVSVFKACIKGTNEVVRPLISSVLTTCVIFVPLIFLSGISGALFYDQAMAVTIGLGVSLIVSFTIIPVYFRLFYSNAEHKKGTSKLNALINNIRFFGHIENAYAKGFDYVFNHKSWIFMGAVMLMVAGVFVFQFIVKERFPAFKQTEVVYHIDWNQNINTAENFRRIETLLSFNDSIIEQSSCLIGEQDFVLDKSNKMSASEAQLYFKVKTESDLDVLQQNISGFIQKRYPEAIIKAAPPETVFEKVFDSQSAPLEVRFKSKNTQEPPEAAEIESLIKEATRLSGIAPENNLNLQKYYELVPNYEKMLLYQVSVDEMISVIKKALNRLQIFTMKNGQYQVPVFLSGEEKNIYDLVRTTTVRSKNKSKIPLSALVTVSQSVGYKLFNGGKSNTFVEIGYRVSEQEASLLKEIYDDLLQNKSHIELEYAGAIMENSSLIMELLIIMLVSIVLLYFILAAQFESLLHPLVVLIEIPIDIGGALLVLFFTGNSLNMMSLIGMIVMTGIVINDSILKIDTINRLLKNNMTMMEAIHSAGKRRLKPIIMTSATTILAMVPFLFSSDIGSRLQQPLAWSIIGGMTIGTLVSLYFVPLCYYYLAKKKKIN